jgi:tetraacyldisaccharide 4'-kinase
MLAAAETLYRVLLERRRRKWTSGAATRFSDCRIISVGNLTTGGTGKTPTVQWLAHRLKADGAKVAVVGARLWRNSFSGRSRCLGWKTDSAERDASG